MERGHLTADVTTRNSRSRAVASSAGRERILAYLRAVGPEGLTPGRLYDHMLLQPVTHVDSPRPSTAQGTLACVRPAGAGGQVPRMGNRRSTRTSTAGMAASGRSGACISIRRWSRRTSRAGARPRCRRSRFEPALQPDAAIAWTGQHSTTSASWHALPLSASGARRRGDRLRCSEVQRKSPDLRATARRVWRIRSPQSRTGHPIENIQTVYGYYLATLLWDDLDEPVRRRWHHRDRHARRLCRQGRGAPQPESLWPGRARRWRAAQPHAVPAGDPCGAGRQDRQPALARAVDDGQLRAQCHVDGWHLREHVREDRRPLVCSKDQQVNTYFAPYETGWKDLAQRAPPGITDSNPPDRPPSFPSICIRRTSCCRSTM